MVSSLLFALFSLLSPSTLSFDLPRNTLCTSPSTRSSTRAHRAQYGRLFCLPLQYSHQYQLQGATSAQLSSIHPRFLNALLLEDTAPASIPVSTKTSDTIISDHSRAATGSPDAQCESRPLTCTPAIFFQDDIHWWRLLGAGSSTLEKRSWRLRRCHTRYLHSWRVPC
ncbi:hypothetical protein B0O80DRAFT_258956 [Mortierella sp. GBAus27b]|nr:hypothetical protein B0O80DRAFT_258956 [Mortierella sp. GBAus27b]